MRIDLASVTSGRWISDELGTSVTSVVPQKLVTPVLKMQRGSREPEAVQVHRTFETVFRRALAKVTGSVTAKLDVLEKVERNGQAVRYESWAAARYPPWRRPTLFRFGDAASDRPGLSAPLQVFDRGALVRANRQEFEGGAKASVPGTPFEAKLGIRSGETIEIVVEAVVDPRLELFALSPVEAPEWVGFESYADAMLGDVEEVLEVAGYESEAFRAAFLEEYGESLNGTARIYIEMEEREVVAGPESPQRVAMTLHPESPGEMMLVIGARDLATGEVTYSEMLPLSWHPDEESERWEGVPEQRSLAARRQQILKQRRRAGLPTLS
jgi:hypothetical protein